MNCPETFPADLWSTLDDDTRAWVATWWPTFDDSQTKWALANWRTWYGATVREALVGGYAPSLPPRAAVVAESPSQDATYEVLDPEAQPEVAADAPVEPPAEVVPEPDTMTFVEYKGDVVPVDPWKPKAAEVAFSLPHAETFTAYAATLPADVTMVPLESLAPITPPQLDGSLPTAGEAALLTWGQQVEAEAAIGAASAQSWDTVVLTDAYGQPLTAEQLVAARQRFKRIAAVVDPLIDSDDLAVANCAMWWRAALAKILATGRIHIVRVVGTPLDPVETLAEQLAGTPIEAESGAMAEGGEPIPAEAAKVAQSWEHLEIARTWQRRDLDGVVVAEVDDDTGAWVIPALSTPAFSCDGTSRSPALARWAVDITLEASGWTVVDAASAPEEPRVIREMTVTHAVQHDDGSVSLEGRVTYEAAGAPAEPEPGPDVPERVPALQTLPPAADVSGPYVEAGFLHVVAGSVRVALPVNDEGGECVMGWYAGSVEGPGCVLVLRGDASAVAQAAVGSRCSTVDLIGFGRVAALTVEHSYADIEDAMADVRSAAA